MNNSSRLVKILLADNQILITEGLNAILKDRFTVTGIVYSYPQLLEALGLNKPDLIIMDQMQVEFDGPDQFKTLIAQNLDIPVIILTNALSRKEITELNACGVKNIITKWVDQEELLECIEAALKGKKYYSQQVLDLLTETSETKAEPLKNGILTASELEIVRLLSQGMTNKDIARQKFLSVHTIMTHRKNIMRKLGTTNVSEMIMHAIRSGMIDNIEYHI